MKPFSDAKTVIDLYNESVKDNSLTQEHWNDILSMCDDSLSDYLTKIKGQEATLTGYNTSLQGNITGFRKVYKAIGEYNKLSGSNSEKQKEYCEAISLTNSKLGSYLTNLNGSKAGMLGYASSLVGATLKTVALQVATTALNAAITMGASLIVTGIITAISNWIRQDEILAEKAETAKQKIDELNNNYKEHSQLVSDSAKRYAELAQGVDQLSGKNLSLNDDDYKEFLDLSNQLAEAFPTLSRHYDENGNAILQLSGNVDTIVGSLNNLIEAERSLKNQEIADELPTVYKNANNKSDDYKKQIDELKEQRKTLIDSLGDVQSDDFSKNFIDGLEKSMISVEGENLETLSKMKDDYLKILKDANIDYEELTPDYENKDGVDVPVRFNIKINSSEEDIEKAKKTIKANVENLASEYEGDISELNDKIQSVQDKNKANWSSLTGSIAAWLNTEDSYKIMSDDMQSTIQNIVNSLDWGELDFSSWEDAKQYIQDNILSLFQTSDGKDVLKNVEVMFGIQTQFNDGEITVNEYQEKLKTFLDEISTLDPDTQKAIKLIFGISTDEDGTTTSSVDTMVNNVKSKLKDEFDDKVGELSLDDLQVASKLEIPEGTLLSWDELKQKIEETKNAASEETTISFSDTMTQLDDMKSKLSAVDQVYAKLFDEDASIGFDDYSSLYDTFKDIEGLDIGSYIEQLQEAGQDQEKVQSTIDSLVGTYVQLSGVLGTVTDSNESLIASMLEEQGVANASDIVHRALIENKINEFLETTNLTNATREEIQAFIDETNAAYGTSITIGDILTAKLNLNGTTINTASDIEQLIALANAAGESASKVAALKNLLANMNGSVDTTTAEGMRSEQLAIKTKEKIEGGTFFSSGVSDWQPLKAEDFITTPYSGGSSTKAAKDKAAKDASKGAKDAEDEAKKAAEEAEKALTDALSHIKNAIDELDKEASDKFSNWSSRNQALADEMGMIPQEIAKQQELYDFYMSQGDTTKAEEAANAIKDLQRNLKELANQKLENIKQFYSDIIDLIDSLKDLKNAYIDLKEAKGLVANEVDYRELMAQSEQERQNYEKELTELQNQLQDNINNGYIEEGSEAWYEWQKELNGIKKSIIECKKEQVEWNNAIKKLPFDALEKYTILIQKATDRINGANDILEAKGLSQSVANINEQLMALNETMSVTVHNRKLIFDALHDGLSDSEYGWADLNEDQIQKVFDYINTDDSLGLHDYLTSLGVDMYQFAKDSENSVWSYVQELSTVNQKIQETEKSQIELNKSIRDMGVKSAEAYGKLIDKANADIDNQSTLWEARGMDKKLAHYQQALQGLDMSIGSASNKRYQDVAKIYANFADGINGWAQLDTAQIDKVMEFVNADNSQGLFEYLGSLGIDASQLDEFWELVEDIQSIDSDITSTKQKQIEFNKALQQMDISTYEKLNELVSKAKTELEGLKNLIESHGKNASDNLLSKQIENSMKSVDLSKSMIGTYRDYISSQLSDNVSGWAKLTQEQINKVFSYLDTNDTDGLNKYFNSLGMSAGTLTEFWEVVNKISSEESNIFSEMTNQEKYSDEMLENRISQLDDIKEKLNKINDAKNKALELEKARFALIQAMNNRNVMTWDGNQMVWTQDSSAVSSATENLNNLEFQALIDSIEDATDSIKELIKNMNLYDDNGNLLSNWKEILASAGTSVDDIVSNIIKTLSARGYNFTDPKFNSGNSVIDSKYKDLISTEDVVDMDLLNSLKSAQQQKTIDLKTYIPDYASIFAKAIQNMPTNNTTTQTTSITYQLNGDFIMPNIHDDAKLDDFIKDLNSLSSKAEQRINKI